MSDQKNLNQSQVPAFQYQIDDQIRKIDNIEENQDEQIFQTVQNKKQVIIEKQINFNDQISNKLPESMKSFLKNKRMVSQLSSDHNKNIFQNQKSKNDTVQQSLIIKQQLIHQQSQTKLGHNLKKIQQKNEEKKTTQNKKIVYPQISISCLICEGPIEKIMIKNQLFSCSHTFCSDCTKNYIIYKINRFELISCPNQNCKQKLNVTSSFYENEISLKQRKKYHKIRKFYQINTPNQNIKVCPLEDCEGIMLLDQFKSAVSCSVCKIQFCPKCFKSIHEGQCIDFEASFIIKKFNLVQCQKCKSYIEKIEGCHHMTCKCGYQFCEKCKLAWQKRHICKFTILDRANQEWGGCDWGITLKDHILFLLKIPVKILLVLLCSLFWVSFSFLGTPLNLLILCYWLYLLLLKPSIEMIKNETQCWKILFEVVFFPFLMVINICRGGQYLMGHLDYLLPQIPNSYRWIIRL